MDSDVEGFNSAEVRAAVIRAHQQVMDAIRAQDGDAAERRMARHVGAYIQDIQQTPNTLVNGKRKEH